MEFIIEIFKQSIFAGLTLVFLQLLIIWLFVRSAIKSGVKNGILDAYEMIKKQKQEPEQEQSPE